ncbi:MAG: ChuX/HutX family heme-like substrate-binding protein [Pseudomonadota bacterium]|nr:ChuX/HutX family heme-like substrate-binding protein [Pseudomonadota bacterium]
MSDAMKTEAAATHQASARAAFVAELAKGRRARDAAHAVGLSEGAAVASLVGAPAGGPQARVLRADWLALLQALEACGPLMALTRNDHAVHEKTGVYTKVSGNARMGIALGEDIDLRLFLTHWHAAFAVTGLAANPGNNEQPSLQFFDPAGQAIHKIYVRPATDLAAWHAVIERFADPAGAPAFRPAPAPEAARPDADIDTPALLNEWAALEDTHDFFGLLKAHHVQRTQALRLAEGRFTQRLSTDAVRALLLTASLDGTPIMCFVGSGGCTQIHTGPIKRIEPMDIRGTRWLNVLDPGFNLHLNEDAIDRVWAVQKPTAEGVVTSVEVFDAQGRDIALFFGARKPGVPELAAWRALVAGLPRLPEAVAA